MTSIRYLITSVTSFFSYSTLFYFFLCLQEETCDVLFAADVHYTGSIEHTQSLPASSTEQPFCPVCLGILPNLVSKCFIFWKCLHLGVYFFNHWAHLLCDSLQHVRDFHLHSFSSKMFVTSILTYKSKSLPFAINYSMWWLRPWEYHILAFI